MSLDLCAWRRDARGQIARRAGVTRRAPSKDAASQMLFLAKRRYAKT
jgi:hypothetical protein